MKELPSIVDHMNENILEIIKRLFDEQRFAVIATQGENNPYTNLVSFLANETCEKIYFPTSKKTKKYENLLRDSRISILIDNRGNKPEDIKNAIAVTAVGTTKGTENQEIITSFLKKHPYLKEFIQSIDSIMIEITIEKYIVVDSFQNVNILGL